MVQGRKLLRDGLSITEVCRHLYGVDGGRPWQKVRKWKQERDVLLQAEHEATHEITGLSYAGLSRIAAYEISYVDRVEWYSNKE